jgi:hypothetical protein
VGGSILDKRLAVAELQFDKIMSARTVPILVLIVFACGCSTAPKHMSAADFQRVYLANKMQTLDWYSYAGETNGCVYTRRTRVALSSGDPTERLFFTETNGLPPGFVAEMRMLDGMRNHSRVEPSGLSP